MLTTGTLPVCSLMNVVKEGKSLVPRNFTPLLWPALKNFKL